MRKWLEERREREYAKAYICGFQWAMAELFIVKTPMTEIEDQIHGCSDAFDKGANYAIRVIVKLSESK